MTFTQGFQKTASVQDHADMGIPEGEKPASPTVAQPGPEKKQKGKKSEKVWEMSEAEAAAGRQ